MDKETGGPAFPEAGLSGLPNGEFIHGQAGMTLRDYFAAQVLPSICGGNMGHNYIAKVSYQVADAMLKERAK